MQPRTYPPNSAHPQVEKNHGQVISPTRQKPKTARFLPKGIETVMNPEPAAVEQQGESEDGISIEDMENPLMEMYKGDYALTDYTVSFTDSQIQIELI